jgi:hypothetical protein
VVPVSFHDFFGGCADVAGALIGLLFVALSVSPEKLTGDNASAEHQVRAGAAFSALVNALVIALVGLLPGASLGETGIILGASGLATTSALIIVLFRAHRQKIRIGDVSTLAGLLVLYGLQLASAVQLNESPRDISGVSRQGVLSIIFFAFAIARAWQLVGAPNLSLPSTVATMIHRLASESTRPEDDGQAEKASRVANQDDP